MIKETARPHLLTSVLCKPELAVELDTRDWECLVWQSRSADLMGQLYHALDAAGMLSLAPIGARRHLEGAWSIAEKHAVAVQHELRGLKEILDPLGIPVILLKGAAYCAQNNLASVGRIFNDIDILVPKADLPAVEERLSWAGWFPTHTNAYDERYYRKWMHEIPPMEHKNRGTALDVHFTILPPTSGIRPNPADFFAAAVPLPGEWAFFSALCREDMVIHSACHLFFGEFHKGLRDLLDLHTLLTGMAVHPSFWRKLLDRAKYLGLIQPVIDALLQVKRIYGTRIPEEVVQEVRECKGTRWPQPLRGWLFEHALRPNHVSAAGRTTALAHWMIFARSHWLRMPLPLLTYHIAHKLFADK
jgi:hypothetical protein